ncbi:hypothetical protein FK85_03005 [Halorubrum saccharovorum]|uniref:Uncharacterized protein n=1 Tax=Halorubrum saccharovorum TaxID=2248 RepID=A0A081EXN8_9EURY|nr:hypothetical protein FK85_03005 [Halorubrum saccharovorum]
MNEFAQRASGSPISVKNHTTDGVKFICLIDCDAIVKNFLELLSVRRDSLESLNINIERISIPAKRVFLK